MVSEEDNVRIQITARISKESLKKLTVEASKRNVPPSSYFSRVLDKHAKYLVTKNDLVIVDRDILKSTYCNESKLKEQIEEQIERKLSEWEVSEEEVTFENFKKQNHDAGYSI